MSIESVKSVQFLIHYGVYRKVSLMCMLINYHNLCLLIRCVIIVSNCTLTTLHVASTLLIYVIGIIEVRYSVCLIRNLY